MSNPIAGCCPICDAPWRLPAHAAAKRARCKQCGGVFVVDAEANSAGQVRRTFVDGSKPTPADADSIAHRPPLFAPAADFPARTTDAGNPDTLAAVARHVTRHIGTPQTILQELFADIVRIDIHVVAPTTAKPYWLFVTSGMSDLPMAGESEKFAEVMLALPANWPIENGAMREEPHYWPIRLLKAVARYPHRHATHIAAGQALAGGRTPTALGPGTAMNAVLFSRPVAAPREFGWCETDDGRVIEILAMIPIYGDEFELARRSGVATLEKRLRAAKVTELLDPQRASVCAAAVGAGVDRV